MIFHQYNFACLAALLENPSSPVRHSPWTKRWTRTSQLSLLYFIIIQRHFLFVFSDASIIFVFIKVNYHLFVFRFKSVKTEYLWSTITTWWCSFLISCLMDWVFYQSWVCSVVIVHQPMTHDFISCLMDWVFYQSRVCSVVIAHQPMIHKQEQDGAWFSFPSIYVFCNQLRTVIYSLCCLHSILFSVSSWERGYISYAVCILFSFL